MPNSKRIEELKAEIIKTRKELREAEKKDWEEFTKDLYARFFKRFKKAAAWLEWAKDFGKKNLFVYSALGRRRHLFGHLVEDKTISAAMDRRSMNSPIQGMGADFGHTGARLIEMNIYEYLLKIGEITEETEKLPVGAECMVHDSVFSSAEFHLVLGVAQIMQWCATIGVQEYYDKHFDLQFTVPLEIELEFGASQNETYKWDWSQVGYDPEIHEWNDLLAEQYSCTDYPEEKRIKEGFFSLECAVKLALYDHAKIYPDIDPESEFKKMFDNWEGTKLKKYLDKHYPVLGNYNYSEAE